MRGVHRIYGVAVTTVIAWLKKAEPLGSFVETLLPAKADDVLEL